MKVAAEAAYQRRDALLSVLRLLHQQTQRPARAEHRRNVVKRQCDQDRLFDSQDRDVDG
eukprot:SAG11_NODE_870_length_6811_cov_36.099508_7_plen_59_part_00